MFKEKALQSLKEAGFKVTKPRKWIVEFLDGNKNHPSAIEIYDTLRAQDKKFSFATVYNTLETLVETGVVKQVTVDPQCSRFDPDINPHGHFYCKSCGKVEDLFDVDIKLGGDAEQNNVLDYELNVYGICKDCVTKN
jgi:Fur family peroxide stress response transcriptional regulator